LGQIGLEHQQAGTLYILNQSKRRAFDPCLGQKAEPGGSARRPALSGGPAGRRRTLSRALRHLPLSSGGPDPLSVGRSWILSRIHLLAGAPASWSTTSFIRPGASDLASRARSGHPPSSRGPRPRSRRPQAASASSRGPLAGPSSRQSAILVANPRGFTPLYIF